MPSNNWTDIEKVTSVLDLEYLLEDPVPVNDAWKVYLQHMGEIYQEYGTLSVKKILRSGKLAPLTEDVVSKVALSNAFSNYASDQ